MDRQVYEEVSIVENANTLGSLICQDGFLTFEVMMS